MLTQSDGSIVLGFDAPGNRSPASVGAAENGEAHQQPAEHEQRAA